jgi:hypothetical protein
VQHSQTMAARGPSADTGGLSRVFDDLLADGERSGWRGWDPYDALRSPLVRALSFGRRWPRIAWIQLVKRSPVNLRPALLVTQSTNPKALGLVARALVAEGRARGLDRRPQVERLLSELDRLRSPRATGSGWGYPFDWQSRAFFVPENTPSIVASTFVANAYLDAYREWGVGRWLGRARETCDFILHDLHRTPGPDGSFCFSYTPVDRGCVHNANLLGAELLARVAAETHEPALREAALASARFTLRAQAADGSWPYGTAPFQSWIDSFHTGFDLVSLLSIVEACDKQEWVGALRRGYAFYRDRLFLADGTPKYFHDSIYPIDIHSAAQALVTFAVFSRLEPDALGIAGRVAGWTFDNMRDRNGRFYFQRHARYTHRTPFVRWGQAWMVYGLARLIAADVVGQGSSVHGPESAGTEGRGPRAED